MHVSRCGVPALILVIALTLSACEYDDPEENEKAEPSPVRKVLDEPFTQISRDEFLRADVEGFTSPAPQPPFVTNAVAVRGERVFVGTDAGLSVWRDGSWDTPVADRPVYSLADKDGRLYLGSTGSVAVFDDAIVAEYFLPAVGRVGAVAVCGGRLYAGSEDGLFVLDGDTFAPVAELAGIHVFTLLPVGGGRVWVGTTRGAYRVIDGEVDLRLGRDDYLLSDKVRAVALDAEDNLWIGTDRGLNVWRSDGVMEAFTGTQGLPLAAITALANVDAGALAGLWIGAERGVAHFADGVWSYFAGRRWLPDDEVTALASGERLWVATANGLSRLRGASMTLAQKSNHYRTSDRARHERLGLVTPCDLDVPGDLSTYRLRATAHDGFGTALALAAASFEYATTGDDAARDRADEHFAALELLEQVTGIPGLPARSVDELYSNSADPRCAPLCAWQANAALGYDWLSNTDAKEVLGHFFAVAVYYDLAADDTRRAMAAAHVGRMAAYLIANDYFLIDWDGEPTTWGVWNPDYLWDWYRSGDLDTAWSTLDRILPHSVELLMFIKTAQRLTGQERFARAYENLITAHALDDLAVNAAGTWPLLVNHENDLALLLSLYPLLSAEDDPRRRTKYLVGLEHAFAVNRLEQNSLFDFIYGALAEGKPDFELIAAVATLRDIPLDLIDWRMENSQRDDVVVDPLPNFRGDALSATDRPPLSAAERYLNEWDGDPFILDAGGEGTREISASFWQLAFWLARYHGFILN